MKKINQKIALSFLFIATVFLLTWCWSKNIDAGVINAPNTDLIDSVAIQGELQEQIDILEAQKTDLSFPSWLSKLNLSIPDRMDIDEVASYQTTEKVEWFNSVHFVYNWDYDNAMIQAEKLAKAANIPVSAEFKMAQDMIKNINSDNTEMQQAMLELAGDMKWIVYTNYSLMWWADMDYMIAITVNENGSLEIDVTDMIAMQKIADQYTK